MILEFFENKNNFRIQRKIITRITIIIIRILIKFIQNKLILLISFYI